MRILEAKGHRVNASCGVHVHIGWKRDWSAQALARLVTIVAYAEKGLYAITGTKKTYAEVVAQQDRSTKPEKVLSWVVNHAASSILGNCRLDLLVNAAARIAEARAQLAAA